MDVTEHCSMNPILQTERLRLREFTLTDTPFIIELLNTPGWLQFIGDRNVHTEEEAAAYLQHGPLKSYRENGYGLWRVETREGDMPVGMCGLLQREHLEHPDIGFAFLPRYSGQGYAAEAARATLVYAKDQLGMASISAITVPGNERSIRLLEKLGLHYVKTFRFPGSKEKLLLYST